MLALGITLSALAGGPVVVGGGHINGGGHTTVIVTRPYIYGSYGLGMGYGYSPFYSPYYGYNPFYSPFAYRQRPSKLDLDIEQIRNDYSHNIADVRHDKTLPATERRAKIRDLRHERNNTIIEAEKSYYHPQHAAPQKDNAPSVSTN